MWKCKKCGEIDNFIGYYTVSTTSFDFIGDPDEFSFEIEDCKEVHCRKCHEDGLELRDIADYIDED